MKSLLRLIALMIAYFVLFMIAAELTNPPGLVLMMTPAQMQQSIMALPIASMLISLMLAYLAIRSRWHGWKLAGSLFLIFYALYGFLGWIELLAFPAVSSRMPAGMLTSTLISGLIIGIPFSVLAVWILAKTHPLPAAAEWPLRLKMPGNEWTWKVTAAAVLYVLVYFTFGYYVAWRTPGVPEFYGGSDPGSLLGQLANVLRETPWLYPLQLLRGLIWVGIGCIIVRMHKGRPWEVMLATGLSFTVLMNASLLFPNPFMPAMVAHAHAVELVSSNFLYGILLAGLLIWSPTHAQSVIIDTNMDKSLPNQVD